MLSALKSAITPRSVVIAVLQVALIVFVVGAGWAIYRQLPPVTSDVRADRRTTSLQIVIRQPPESAGSSLDMAVNLYPVDIVAVQHEFFTEPRHGKRFEDFLTERMRGRVPVKSRLDRDGSGIVILPPGNWWLHAVLSGDEQLEWRLPVTVGGATQTIELTPQNAYTRSRSF